MKIVREHINEIKKGLDGLTSVSMGKSLINKKLAEFISDIFSYTHLMHRGTKLSAWISAKFEMSEEKIVEIGIESNFTLDDVVEKAVKYFGEYKVIHRGPLALYVWDIPNMIILSKKDRSVVYTDNEVLDELYHLVKENKSVNEILRGTSSTLTTVGVGGVNRMVDIIKLIAKRYGNISRYITDVNTDELKDDKIYVFYEHLANNLKCKVKDLGFIDIGFTSISRFGNDIVYEIGVCPNVEKFEMESDYPNNKQYTIFNYSFFVLVSSVESSENFQYLIYNKTILKF